VELTVQLVEAVSRARNNGYKVAQTHFKYLNPFPKNTGDVLKKYKKVLCPELNMGQFARYLKSEFLIDVESLNKIQGLPFKSSEIEDKIYSMLGGSNEVNKGNSTENTEVKYTAKDFSSDQDVRWCPGCGDYSILAQMQRVSPDLG
jgi:pyruvate/2-oxoacid:ferredoxin oxidoreductase alpha subunit